LVTWSWHWMFCFWMKLLVLKVLLAFNNMIIILIAILHLSIVQTLGLVFPFVFWKVKTMCAIFIINTLSPFICTKEIRIMNRRQSTPSFIIKSWKVILIIQIKLMFIGILDLPDFLIEFNVVIIIDVYIVRWFLHFLPCLHCSSCVYSVLHKDPNYYYYWACYHEHRLRPLFHSSQAISFRQCTI